MSTNSDYKWLPNSITCNTIYKCKKVRISANYIPDKCSWEGTLGDYIQHVKNKHATCFFIIFQEPQKFEWKLPFIGDQTDLGIFRHNFGHFLYEIYYTESSGEIYFSLAYFGELRDSFRYQILFGNAKGNKKIFSCQVNRESDDILKPISEQKHKIIIEKNIMLNYLDPRRVFQWYITITAIAEEPALPKSV